MKRTKNKKDDNQSQWELFDESLIIPINIGDKELGNLRIDFEISEDLNTSEEEDLAYQAFRQFTSSEKFWEKDIDAGIRFGDKSLEKMKEFGLKVNPFLIQHIPLLTPRAYYDANEDEIFEFIKSEGPLSLRNPTIQYMLESWLFEEKTAGLKINRLKDCLMEYALGQSYEEKLMPTGRPEAILIKELGEKWVKDMYKDITQFLKIAKRNREEYRTAKIYEIINHALENFVSSLEDEHKRKPSSQLQEERFQRAKGALEKYRELNEATPLAKCIMRDKYLRAEFQSFRWEPNKLAKKLVAKLLDVSVSTVEKILYSRK